MGFENFDMTENTVDTSATNNEQMQDLAKSEAPRQGMEQADEPKLGAGQVPDFYNYNLMGPDLMPKFRFTTDKAEAEAAAQADRSDPFNLPPRVIYVEVPDDAAEQEKKPAQEYTPFLNESYELNKIILPSETTPASGEYVGPSIEALDRQLENDTKNLTKAQLQLEEAIERGTGVMSAMNYVENAQKVLDARMKLYNEAIAFRAPDAPAVGSKTDAGQVSFGSVSHAEWRLKTAYEHESPAEVAAAKRYLAQEKAKEEAKKMK